MNVSIGADHGGFHLKEFLKGRLSEAGYSVLDRGSFDPSPVDYPDIAFKVAADVLDGCRGILICGTGVGMCNAASRVEGIIAALCTNEYMGRMARLHNDANVLCLGARVVGDELAWDVSRVFLETPTMNDEKYIRRREKVARGCR
ncbi:MAG: ribose 5-phosphate isomerase B [Thermoplasmatota archaeon]